MKKRVVSAGFTVATLVFCAVTALNGWTQTPPQPELVPQLGHSADVSVITFSPDGSTLATGSYDGTVKLWDPRATDLKRTLPKQEGLVQAVAYSHDGKIIASAGDVVELREAGTGKLIRLLKGNGSPATTLAFSPVEGILAIGRMDETVALWDVAQSKYLRTFTVAGADVDSIAFSPDGSVVAAGCWFRANYSGQVRLWNVKTGRALPSLGYPSGAEGMKILFSPDKKTLAVTSGGWSVMLWDWRAKKLLQTLSWEAGGELRRIAFSPDGKQLATGGFFNTVRLWDVASGKKTHAITGVEGIIESLAYSPDGKYLLCGTSEGAIKLWETLKWLPERGIEGINVEVNDTQFSPDGNTLAIGVAQRQREGYSGGTQVWDVSNGQFKSFLTRKNQPVRSIGFSPNGKLLATGEFEGGISLWDVPAGKLLKTLTGHRDMVMSLAFLDNRNLAGKSRAENSIRLWDTLNGKSKIISNGAGYGFLAALAASPDRKLFAVADAERVQIFNARTLKLQQTLKVSPVLIRSLSFSPDGALLAISSISIAKNAAPNSIQLWDVASAKLRKTFALTGADFPVHSLAFTADGKNLISGGDRIRIWDVASGKVLRSWVTTNALSRFPLIALSRTGKFLSTGQDASGLEIRDLEGQLLATLIYIPNKKTPAWLAFTPEGYYDASPEGEKFIRWRLGDKLLPAAEYKQQFHRPDLLQKALSGQN